MTTIMTVEQYRRYALMYDIGITILFCAVYALVIFICQAVGVPRLVL